MDHVPTGSILLVLLIDLGLLLGLSGLFGAAVARSAGSRSWLGILVGVLLPVVGPLVWAVVAAGRDRDLAGLQRRLGRDPRTLVPVGLLGLGALLFAVATPLSWAKVTGDYDGYSLATDASPSDSVVGAIATVGSTLLLALLAVVLLLTSARRRIGLMAGLVAGAWLVVTLDSLVVISALDGLAADVSGASGGRADADAAAAAGLWACLLGGLVVIGTAGYLAIGGPADDVVVAGTPAAALAATPAAAIPSTTPPAGWGAPGSWDAAPSSGTGGSGSGWGSPADQWGSNDRGGNAW